MTTLLNYINEKGRYRVWYPQGVTTPSRYEVWLNYSAREVVPREGESPQDTWGRVLQEGGELRNKVATLNRIMDFKYLNPYWTEAELHIYADCERRPVEVERQHREWLFIMATFMSHPLLEKSSAMRKEAAGLLKEFIGRAAVGGTDSTLARDAVTGVPYARTHGQIYEWPLRSGAF